jgi:lysophospholipase L1-like esterase
MKPRHYLLPALLLAGLWNCSCDRGAESTSAPEHLENQNRWEQEIRAFEVRDSESRPAEDGILFVGSSSIRRWDLEASFPDLPVINRGFGGSHMADSVKFATRIITPYRPRAVVVYAGDNDIAAGKTPERVFDDFRKLERIVRNRLPDASLIYIAIKPSLLRWRFVGKMRKANSLIRARTEEREWLHYVDIDTPMIGPGGQPRPELFLPDGVHLNAKGYELWAELVRRKIARALGD